MYAVIETGGKQYRVAAGDILKVEKLELEPGSAFDFDRILLLADGDDVNVGTPTVSGGKVSASVVEHGRHKKVEILKFKRRKHHMKRMGHRQDFTEVKIEEISLGSKKSTAAAKPAAKKSAAKAEAKPAEKKAAPKKEEAKKPAAKKAEAKPAAKKTEAKAETKTASKKADAKPAAKKAEAKKPAAKKASPKKSEE